MTSRCGWRASLKSRFQCPRQPGFDSQYRQIGKRHFLFALFGAMLSTDNDLYFLRLSLHTSKVPLSSFPSTRAVVRHFTCQ
ncbi:hypothetical protein HBH56_032730 [Parastagonospora nodorum]|nr:hypothetical protein HBH56_032730 [Parastagonospora nodorum]KAH3979760.1 hypothetical protein HBH51_054360 [Parastagonospora nodorum]KAH4031707.1 hypothetical protein HBI13_014450 [Parastagonospora nodorum]KAH4097755.1 hypothetical protein HBH48_023550 [Parastagonospora nodorum]KAH4125941.1 hypothetical protein HBH47_053090 [Parastagonospora nodorum]